MDNCGFNDIPTLFQWPPSEGVDSIFPRCTIIHRMFQELGIEYDVKNVGLPYLESKLDDPLRKLLVQLPLLRTQETYLKSTREIIEYTCKAASVGQAALAQIYLISLNDPFFEWANNIFLNTLLYFRWLKDKNYESFIKKVEWGAPEQNSKDFHEALLKTRIRVINYVRTDPIGSLKEKAVTEILISQLQDIEEKLKKSTYLSNNPQHPDLKDFAVFMVIQGLLDPSIEERELILLDYPNIKKWVLRIDSKTNGPHTRTIIF